MLKCLVLCLSFLVVPHAAGAASVFTSRPDDPAAVHVDPPDAQPGANHTALLQAALDQAAASPAGGIVLVPAGRYRITRTLIVWRAVRIIGYGATRPVFVLPERTPGFQSGLGVMVHFTNARPARGGQGGQGSSGPARVAFPPPGFVPPKDDVPDANQTTFYSSMMNVDFEIGDGNPAAAAVRFHVAQHGILSDIDFNIGSGLAGIIEVGNVGQRLRFIGGRYGIMATSTSPFWPYTLIDSTFEGQREAAIREHQTGLTVVRTTFRDVPVGISIDKAYSDHLWLKDARFENVATAAVVFDRPQNALTQIGAEDVICVDTPVFARDRESGRTAGTPSAAYRVRRFNHGLFVRGSDSTGLIEQVYDAEPLATAPAALAPALPALPPMEQWVNVRSLGVMGDGKTDDTKALQAAIDSQRVLYFPTGSYVVRDTLALKPDTALIALHPATARLDLADRLDAFAGVGEPKGLLEAPSGGRTIVSGLGLFPGATNPRATAVLWMAGRESFLNDVMIHWFASGPPGPGGRGRSGAQYPSIWVTRGGGGTFHTLWTASPNAQSGFYVSDTTTPGVVYELSAEHHLYGEIKLDRVENWEFHGPQTEEEVSSQPRGRGVRDQRLEEHHDRELSRLPRDPQLQPVPGGDPRLRIDRHPAAQRLGERRARLRRLRRQRLRHEAAVGEVRVRQRRRGRDEPPRGARAPVRGARSGAAAAGRGSFGAGGAGSARDGRKAGRRLPLDRGRGRGRRGHAVLRRSPSAADLLVVAVAAPEDRARRAARRGQPRRRSVGEPARALDGRAGGHGLCVPSRRPARRAHGAAAAATTGSRRGARPRSCCRRPSGPTASSAAISTWPPTSTRRWPRCSPAR